MSDEVVDLEFERATRDVAPKAVFNGAWWASEDDESWYCAGKWMDLEDGAPDLNSWQKAKLLRAAADMSEHQWAEELEGMDPDLLFDNTCAVMRTAFPGFDLRYKADSQVQRLIGAIVPGYARRASTWGSVVFLPARPAEGEKPAWRALQHECVHVWDAHTLCGIVPSTWSWAGFVTIPLFVVLWWMPQILAAGIAQAAYQHGLMSVWVALACLAMFLIASPVRVYSELRALRRTLELWPRAEREERAKVIAGSLPEPWRSAVRDRIARWECPYGDSMNSWLSFTGRIGEEDAGS